VCAASPSCRLLIGEVDRTFRHACFCLLHGVRVRRANAGKIVQLACEGRAGESLIEFGNMEWIIHYKNGVILTLNAVKGKDLLFARSIGM
jgi:hypothetical protein